MHLILGEALGNCAAAIRLYAKRYLERILPNPRTYQSIDRPTRETGTVRPSTVHPRRSAPVVDMGERIRDA
jgi:hypothetical protein